MYWMNVLGAVCGLTAMLLAAFKGRRVQAGAWACLAGYTVFSKIFPAVLPEWLVNCLPAASLVLLVIEFINRRRVRPRQEDDASLPSVRN